MMAEYFFENFIFYFDYFGVTAAAISGMLAAMEKGMDYFGAFILAFVTALGGGTTRDILIQTDIMWVVNVEYIYCIIIVVIVGSLIRNELHKLRKVLFLFDSISLGVFTIIGAQKGLTLGCHPAICITVGVITGCFGGLIRDILRNEIPLIFHKEVYATISLLGAITYVTLYHFSLVNVYIPLLLTALMVGLRILVVRFKLAFPPLTLK